jgi:uncharacterized cofD-like protein
MPKKIVCLGGGTGTSMILSGLLNYSFKLKAIVTMFDEGGSSGKLKKEFNILPPGDLRQCLVAASKNKDLNSIFTYRFSKGSLKGHSLGNLLIVAAKDKTGDLNLAIDKLRKIFNIKTEILPVTLKGARIKARLKNNKIITGEENIINYRNLSKIGVKKIFLEPPVKANPKAISTIRGADLIIIGPGKFYTSVIPNFLVQGISKAVLRSKGKKIFICNLMTQEGNTDDFKVEDFVRIVEEYLGKNVIDYVIFNTGKLPSATLKKVKKIFPKSDFVSYGKDLLKRNNFIGKNLLDSRVRKLNPADILVKGANQRTMVFHDSKKLAKIILKVCKP